MLSLLSIDLDKKVCVSDQKEVCVCMIYKKLAGSVSQLLGIFSVRFHIFIDIHALTTDRIQLSMAEHCMMKSCLCR